MKLFLDDYRQPYDCLGYMHKRIGQKNPIYNEGEWYVVRSFTDFKKAIHDFGKIITVVSFDHDLADGHYHQNMQEGVINYESDDFKDDAHKTGYHAAQYMISYFEYENIPLPMVLVHSMNPIGYQNIVNLFVR